MQSSSAERLRDNLLRSKPNKVYQCVSGINRSVLGQTIYGQTVYGQTVYGQTVEGQTVYETNNIQGLTVEGTKSIQDKRYTGQTVYWDISLKNGIHFFFIP